MKKAVLVKYDKNFPAPLILAKCAQKEGIELIKSIANKENIPIIENKPLAEGLFTLNVGNYLDSKYFEIIAKILSEVYKYREGN